MANRIELARFELENLDELFRITKNVKGNIDDLREANKELAKQGDASSEAYIQNAAEIKKLNKQYNANLAVIGATDKAIKGVEKRTELLNIALKQEINTIDDARASNKLLTQLRNSANAATSEGVEEIRKLNNALDANNAFIKDNVDQYTQQKIGIGGYKDAITDAINELNPLNTSVSRNSDSFKNLTNGIKGAARATLAFIATPIGAFLTLLAGVGLIAKQFFDYNNSIRDARITTEALTNTTGELADTIRNRAGAISEVFGNDFDTNIRSAKNLVDEFGLSYEDAFDKIEDGLIRGGSKNDDFLRSLGEYGVFFSKAGFSAEEFINIINTGPDLSIYDDKLPDAIKEFDISIREQTTSTKDALLNAFGEEFTNQLLSNVSSGAISVKDALQEISEESTKSSLNLQQQAQLTADLFRGAGEDAGGALLIFEAVNTALDDEIVVLTELEQQIFRQLELQKQLGEAKDNALKSDSIIALSEEFSNFSTWIETKFYQVIGGIGDLFFSVSDRLVAFALTGREVLSSALSFESISPSELIDQFNATLQVLEQRREATVEIANRQAEQIKEAKRKENEDLARQQEEAEARKAARKAEAHERELEREAEQLERLHEQVRAALDRDAQTKLDATRNFEDRKRALENEIELARAETDLEKEILRVNNEAEKEQIELERITLSEERKTELLKLIEENRGLAVAEIKKKYNDLNFREQKKADSAELKQKQENSRAIAQVQNQLVGILTGLLGDSLGAKLAAIAIDAAIEASAVGIKSASASAQNLSTATAVGYPANLFTIPAAIAQNVSNSANSASAITRILSSAALRGIGTAVSSIKKFEEGGFIGGRRHSEGGTLIEAEKGEFIFSRKAVNMFGSLLPQMNAAAGGNTGLNNTGFFVDGGLVGRSVSQGSSIDVNEIADIVIESVGSIPVVNVADETLSVANDNAIIVENASI